jgi:hypothetical protein
VGPATNQFAKVGNLFPGMHRHNTLGLVWFDLPHSGGVLHQDWHIEGNQPAEAAFRMGIST